MDLLHFFGLGFWHFFAALAYLLGLAAGPIVLLFIIGLGVRVWRRVRSRKAAAHD